MIISIVLSKYKIYISIIKNLFILFYHIYVQVKEFC